MLPVSWFVSFFVLFLNMPPYEWPVSHAGRQGLKVGRLFLLRFVCVCLSLREVMLFWNFIYEKAFFISVYIESLPPPTPVY